MRAVCAISMEDRRNGRLCHIDIDKIKITISSDLHHECDESATREHRSREFTPPLCVRHESHGEKSRAALFSVFRKSRRHFSSEIITMFIWSPRFHHPWNKNRLLPAQFRDCRYRRLHRFRRAFVRLSLFRYIYEIARGVAVVLAASSGLRSAWRSSSDVLTAVRDLTAGSRGEVVEVASINPRFRRQKADDGSQSRRDTGAISSLPPAAVNVFVNATRAR